MTHRQILKAYLAGLILKNKRIIDWGSGSKPVWRYIQNENCTFVTVDNAKGIPEDRKSNHIDWDITKTINMEKQADVAFCLEVLEHVTYPDNVLTNIYNNLKVGGTLYLSAPFKYEHHGEQDYWRFTDQGLKYLLERNNFQVANLLSTRDDLGWIVKAVKL